MIVDHLINIETYRNLSEDIYDGLLFISNANKDILLGNYQINEKVRAIVSSYETIECLQEGYESHQRVIDIQYPIIGTERVKWSPINDMNINIPYDQSFDRVFYKNPIDQKINIDCLSLK